MSQETNLAFNQFLGFRDLTEEELQDINGGWGHLVLAAGLGIVFVVGVYNGYTDAKKK